MKTHTTFGGGNTHNNQRTMGHIRIITGILDNPSLGPTVT